MLVRGVCGAGAVYACVCIYIYVYTDSGVIERLDEGLESVSHGFGGIRVDYEDGTPVARSHGCHCVCVCVCDRCLRGMLVVG